MKRKLNLRNFWLVSGGILWLFFMILHPSISLKSIHWVKGILLLVPLLLAPLVLQIASISLHASFRKAFWFFPTAYGLALSFALPAGLFAAMLATPWLLASLFLMGLAGQQLLLNWQQHNWAIRCLASAFLFLPVGAAAAVANRLGWEPLGFTPIIILLTAVHFHYAGLILPTLTGLTLMYWRKPTWNWVALGIILGVPLVGLGITTTQLAWSPWIEACSVSLLAIAAISSALLQMGLAIKSRKSLLSSGLLAVSACSLLLGMLLALCYGWRTFFPISILTIPWMYAVHGTLNSVGFAASGLLGWLLRRTG